MQCKNQLMGGEPLSATLLKNTHGYVYENISTNDFDWCANDNLSFLLSDLHAAGELPDIDDILKLRKNLKTMNVLCNHFLPCVVGKK